MRKSVMMLAFVFLAGCMTPRAQSYLDACLESGRNPGECKMLAHEIDMRAWRALQDAGAAMQRAAPPPPTVCHAMGPYQSRTIICQ